MIWISLSAGRFQLLRKPNSVYRYVSILSIRFFFADTCANTVNQLMMFLLVHLQSDVVQKIDFCAVFARLDPSKVSSDSRLTSH
jgi:hypothetical protein